MDGFARVDMHCHLDFAGTPGDVAAAAAADGTAVFSVTISPAGYESAVRELAPFDNVRVGLGLHPWWIADGRCGNQDVERFAALAPRTRLIGEVGLDFGRRCAGSEERQRRAFERVTAVCATVGDHLLSLHAVHAEDDVLDALERHGCTQNGTCIFHWFSGSSDQLQRAIRLGCRFSVGARMLASKRGRAYVQAIPADLLLLETDAPGQPNATFGYRDLRSQLQAAFDGIAAIRGEDTAERAALAGLSLLG